MRGRWLARLGLVLGGLGLGAAGAELAARLASPQPAEDLLAEAPESAPPELYAPDPAVLMHPVAGYAGYSGRGVFVRTDGLGCRGEEPAPDERAWLAVGDSFTLAVQVPEDETFAAGLAERLGAPVFNCGADGWTVFQAALRYQQLAAARPLAGVVYVLFTGNDPTEARLYLSLARLPREADGAPRLPPPPNAAPPGSAHPAPGLRERLRRNSVLWSAWEVSRRRARAEAGDYPEARRFQEEFGLFSGVEPQRYAPAWSALRDGLRALSAAAAGRGDRLVVAVAPPVFAVEPERARESAALLGFDPGRLDVDGPQRQALAMLGELGIAACDLQAPLREAVARGGAPYLRYDGHWSADGHAVVADAIAACILETPPSEP